MDDPKPSHEPKIKQAFNERLNKQAVQGGAAKTESQAQAWRGIDSKDGALVSSGSKHEGKT